MWNIIATNKDTSILLNACKLYAIKFREEFNIELYNILIKINTPKIKAKLLENRLKKNIDIQELINIFISYNNKMID